jgi:putative hydrolase of the HAD superfamily
MQKITTIFWDIGGVVLTNGWDREQRVKVLNEFGITSKAELDEFGDRHREVAGEFETGKYTIDEYLSMTLSGLSLKINFEDFKKKMLEQSQILPGFEVLKEIASFGNYFLSALNNESSELNNYRIQKFELKKYFKVFFSSCYVRLMKPNPEIYKLALNITQKIPSECIFIDDRLQNIESAWRCGINAIQYNNPHQLRNELKKLEVKI